MTSRWIHARPTLTSPHLSPHLHCPLTSQGLNVLYPDCTHAISVPVCDKVSYNIGWLRLGVWVVVPILLALVLMLCIFTYTSHHQNKRLDSQIKLRMKRSADLLVAKGEVEEHKENVRRASIALKEHKELAEKRIDREARRRSVVMFEELQKVFIAQSISLTHLWVIHNRACCLACCLASRARFARVPLSCQPNFAGPIVTARPHSCKTQRARAGRLDRAARALRPSTRC